MLFTKKNLFILLGVVLLITLLILAFFGYQTSNQNQSLENRQQAYQSAKEEVGNILDEVNQSIIQNPSPESQNISENPTSENIRVATDQNIEGTGMTINKNTPIQQIIEIQNQQVKNNYKFETFQYDNLENHPNRVLDQPNFRFYSKFLTKVSIENKQEYILGYGIRAIYDFEHQGEKYWFIITENLASQSNFYFINSDFTDSWQIDIGFSELNILMSLNRLDNNQIVLRFLNSQDRMSEQKINILDLLNQPSIQI